MSATRPDPLVQIAEEAYLFGFPLVLMERTRELTTALPLGARSGYGPMNWFVHRRTFPPGDFREVVRPNFDTLYSTLWFDLSAEPLVITVPDTGGRYYMLPFLDMWTEVFAVVGSRTTGTAAGAFALVGPGWRGDLPDGLQRIDAPTRQGWVIGRTRTDGPGDYPAVHEIQDGFLATPLSVWPETPTEPEPATDPGVDTATPPLDAVLGMTGAELLSRSAHLMQRNAPHLTDQPVLARMRRLGLTAGQPFDPESMSLEVAAAVEAGAEAARARMVSSMSRMSPVQDGWSLPTFLIGVYGTDYLRRALVAKVGLGANRPEDAVYPVLLSDATGSVPVGETDYVLHFAAGALPPADAFWSVTMYDFDGFPVPNPLERYALGDRDPLVYNADGSLDLYLQQADPGDARRPNWLPSPSGPLGATLRLYDPRPDVLDGTWTPPPLVPA